MFRRRFCATFPPLALLAMVGCTSRPASPPPTPPPVARRPARLPDRVRQEGWITRFWEELTASQRRRVLARLRRGEPPAARTEAEAAPLWDGLGLPERDALVFGPGLPRQAGHTASGVAATTTP